MPAVPSVPAPATPPLTPAATAAYTALYTTAYPTVLSLLTRSVAPSEAEDLAQTTFLKVYCHWSTLAPLPREAQCAFVLEVARNTLRDAQRRAYAHPGGGLPTSLDRLRTGHDGADLSQLDGETDAVGATLASRDPHDDPEAMTILREAVTEALGGVPLEQAGQRLATLEVVLLASGFTSAEVAAHLHAAAAAAPHDPQADYFRTVTARALKARKLRRRAALRVQQRQRAAAATTPTITPLTPPTTPPREHHALPPTS